MTEIHRQMNINRRRANIALNRAHLQDLEEEERNVLQALRENYTEMAKIEIEIHRSIFVAEQNSDPDYLSVYKKRKDILDKFRESNADGLPSVLIGFWLKVLNGAGIEFEDPEDEKILLHLTDIRSRMFVQPNVRMLIEFEFEKNKYFSNTLLTKTYNVKCRAEPKEAIFYDGIEITSMEGTQINWLIHRNQTCPNGERVRSFFDYFDDRADGTYMNRGLLDEEIAFGFFLREKVIPKAVFFFTGEISVEKQCIEEEETQNLSEDGRSSEAEEENLAYKHYSDSEGDGDGDDEREASEEFPERPLIARHDENMPLIPEELESEIPR